MHTDGWVSCRVKRAVLKCKITIKLIMQLHAVCLHRHSWWRLRRQACSLYFSVMHRQFDEQVRNRCVYMQQKRRKTWRVPTPWSMSDVMHLKWQIAIWLNFKQILGHLLLLPICLLSLVCGKIKTFPCTVLDREFYNFPSLFPHSRVDIPMMHCRINQCILSKVR
jgi:hypothetical protein